MPSLAVSQQMPASCGAVFALLHDYQRRLEWDTLLAEARLTRGSLRAEAGATSLCVAKRALGSIGIETRYVTFREGSLAAVEMINRPPFFDTFAASIRHQSNESGSLATYKLHFRAKPRWLRPLLEPVMALALRHETRRRLRALARHLEEARMENPAAKL